MRAQFPCVFLEGRLVSYPLEQGLKRLRPVAAKAQRDGTVVVLPFVRQPFLNVEDQRAEVGVQHVDETRGDTVRQLGAVHAPPGRDEPLSLAGRREHAAGAQLQVMIADRDHQRSTCDRVPLHPCAVQRSGEHETAFQVRV